MGRAGGAWAIVMLACICASPAIGAPTTEDGRRAVATYVAMQRYFFDVRSRRYRETAGGPASAPVWPVSQAVAAAIAVTHVPGANPLFRQGVEARIATLERYRAGSAYAAIPGDRTFFLDDDEWLAQDFLDWHDQAPSAQLLSRAAGIFAVAVHSWDADATHPCSGGVFWTTTVSGLADRNVVSTANGAIVGLRIYAITHQPVYLYWSRRMLDWLDSCMRSADGLYWDHIRGNGTVDQTEWSYNQGSVIGAFVLLARLTNDPTALARAEAVADAALAYYQGERLAQEPPAFAAIFFRNVIGLGLADGRAGYLDAARSYADSLWSRRDPATGLIASHSPARLLDQAGAAQLFALLAKIS